MKCITCKKEVILKPTATERARKYGETADYYTKLFPKHAECILKERRESVSAIIAKGKMTWLNLTNFQNRLY